MELRRLHLSGCARQADDVARLHRLAAPDVDAPGVTIGTHPAAAMVDQDQSAIDGALIDRKSGVKGKSVSVRVDLGGRRNINKKTKNEIKTQDMTFSR